MGGGEVWEPFYRHIGPFVSESFEAQRHLGDRLQGVREPLARITVGLGNPGVGQAPSFTDAQEE